MYPRGDKLKVGSSSLNAAPDSGDLADQTWKRNNRILNWKTHADKEI